MACSKSDTCANYKVRCYDCQVISSPFNSTPYYAEKKRSKFKIFFGIQMASLAADDRINKWLDEHPNVRVISYQYQHTRTGDHSICIMYEEETK